MSKGSPSPAPRRPTRIGDAEREAAAEQLRAAVGDGRLELAELDDRLASGYGAKTQDELTETTHDLLPAVSASKPLALRTKSSSMKRTGRWVVPAEIIAECTSGSIKLDFTEAEVPYRTITVRAKAKSGSVLLVVPHDWAVVMDDVSSSSGSVVNKVGYQPAAPTHTVEVIGGVTSGVVKARYPRRSFWDWLRRRPHPALRRP